MDEEVRRLIDNAHDEAYAILTENRDVLDRLALALLERETLNQNEIAEIFRTCASATSATSGSPRRPGRSTAPAR